MDQIHQTEPFPEIPVFVITGGKENRMMPEEVRKKRLEHQLELLSLSKKSKHIVAQKSGHFSQLLELGVVINTIKDCVKQITKTKDNLLLDDMNS
ncbi:hypothetical protein [Domibacillus iocasae]|uniref:hypothetical protein n=1 Tax=Domibacillus iocasae TaxID=1714016 RepID=UPI001FE0046B|nr:hypothetical protein [Domibacillus iocasae]